MPWESGRPLVVTNGTVYVAASERLFAIDTATHTVKWKFAAPPGPNGSNNLGRVAIANGTVYVGSQNYKVYALDAATGAIQWKYTTRDEVIASPTVSNGIVYIGSKASDGRLYALDALGRARSDGSSRPSSRSPSPIRSWPTVSSQ